MRRWYVEQEETGLYYHQGTWEEEPEFFSNAEALAIIRSPARAAEKFGTILRSGNFSASELEAEGQSNEGIDGVHP